MKIHIAGASGCGKSTLYYEITKRNQYRNYVIYELDQLFYTFMEEIKDESVFENIKDEFEKYINQILDRDRDVILIGINSFIRSVYYKGKYIDIKYRGYYDINVDKKYYLYLDTEEILRRKFSRELERLKKKQTILLNNYKKDRIGTQNKINYKINLLEWEQETEKWNKEYKDNGYEFVTKNTIYGKIPKI